MPNEHTTILSCGARIKISSWNKIIRNSMALAASLTPLRANTLAPKLQNVSRPVRGKYAARTDVGRCAVFAPTAGPVNSVPASRMRGQIAA